MFENAGGTTDAVSVAEVSKGSNLYKYKYTCRTVCIPLLA